MRRDLVDLLLVTSEALGRSLPGAERPVAESALADVVAALDSALAGADPVLVPRLPAPAEPEPVVAAEAETEEDEAPVAAPVGQVPHVSVSRNGDNVRVPTRRVHDLLDVVGEAELDVRRIERQAQRRGGSAGRAPRSGAQPARTRCSRSGASPRSPTA